MQFIIRSLSLLLIGSTFAQYDDIHSFEGHNIEGYELKQPLPHQSLEENHGEEYDIDYHAHPKYSFDYSVKDPHTGDEKEHWETRDGDKVKGTYTLVETDGTKRIVEYEADDKNGFNAVVHKIGTPKEHEPVKLPKKPVIEYQHHEPILFEPEYQHFDEGFVPVSGGFEH